MNAARFLALLLSAAGVVVLVLVLKPPPEPEFVELQSSSQCLECHPNVAAEWRDSWHARAYVDPEVRRLSNDFANEECIACHAPRPVLHFQAGERVLARFAERDLGVDCLACHQLPDGAVATSSPDPPAAPCRPRHSPRLADVSLCASCHDQHGTVRQWAAAPPELKGEGCLDCHAEPVPRPAGRMGRAHHFPGGHDLDMLRRAVELRAEAEAEGRVRVELENVGAGHNFPTDERSRAADLQWRERGADGVWSEWRHLHRFRDPYRDETDLTNTQLPAGETWRGTVAPEEAGAEVEVRLLYRTNPFQPDEEATEVHRVSVAAGG